MKAVLVIEMPNSCSDCNYCGFEQFTKYPACVICESNFGKDENIENNRSVICPLKSLPEPKDIGYPNDDYDVGFGDGWDACLKEITE